MSKTSQEHFGTREGRVIKNEDITNCKYANKLQAAIIDGDARILVGMAKEIAEEMVKKDRQGKVIERASVSTSQIRNIYGTSKKIEMVMDDQNVAQCYKKLLLLKPKMAYANGRYNRKNDVPGFSTLVDCLSAAIDLIDGKKERMENFFNLFEAILAYHRAEGGK